MAATHLVTNAFDPWTSGPPLSVPIDKWSQKIWSPWTNGPQPIWSPYFQIITACHPGQTEYSYIFGDHLFGRGTKFLGTICPWGQNCIGWGPFVQKDQLIGDQLWGTNCGGPNVRGPYVFGTKCVTANSLL